MDIESSYQKVLSDLAQGHRALQRFSLEELEELRLDLEKEIESKNSDQIEKLLCLIEHSAALYGKFEEPILKVLNLNISDRITIFALNCSRKHIIQEKFFKGNRLNFEFLEALKALLHANNPEVIEWTLRTIEECGNQGVYFLRELDKIKPPPWKWFNPHQRAVREIITLLERRWSRFERP